MGMDTENRKVLFEVEILGPSDEGRCFVCNSSVRPMHTVRPRGGDYGRYACFAHVSDVMLTWDNHEKPEETQGW